MARRRKKAEAGHGADERWLLTYADMLTLLLALFIVMYAISSINVSKAEAVQQSLQGALNGKITPGGQTIKESGADREIEKMATAPAPSLQAAIAPASPSQGGSAEGEQRSLEQLRQLIQSEARRQGIAAKVETEVRPDGLLVRLKTDGILFDPGQAVVKPQAKPLLRRIAQLLRADGRHAVMVSGHTDSDPVGGGAYPTNWELSTARSSAVVRELISHKLSPARLTATGRAYHDPVASNATAKGRAANRRVELFLPRSHSGATD